MTAFNRSGGGWCTWFGDCWGMLSAWAICWEGRGPGWSFSCCSFCSRRPPACATSGRTPPAGRAMSSFEIGWRGCCLCRCCCCRCCCICCCKGYMMAAFCCWAAAFCCSAASICSIIPSSPAWVPGGTFRPHLARPQDLEPQHHRQVPGVRGHRRV